VEGKDQVADLIGLADAILQLDEQLPLADGRFVDRDAEHFDARLAAAHGLLHRGADALDDRAVDRLEDKVVNAAAEVRAHHALAGGGLQDDEDRLADVVLERDGVHEAGARVELDRHRPAAAEEVLALVDEVLTAHPRITVAAPSVIAFGALASITVSPCRAAGRPPIITVTLPTPTTPPTWGLPGGSTSGQACVSDPARHAGIPPISTVGAPGPGPSGVPWLVRSPMRAAGCPIGPPSVDLHQRPADGQRGIGLQLQRAGGLDGDGGGLYVELHRQLERHRTAVAVDLDLVAALVLHREAVVVEGDLAALLVRQLHHALRAVVE